MDGFLLTTADFYGTLAAARCLGERGVRVTMADSWPLAPALWSRHVSRKLRPPREAGSEEFTSWLLQTGLQDPGDVLYPTSDELAWVFALRARDLEPAFRLYQPPAEVVFGLLDKRSLYDASRRHGIETPQTWFPDDEGQLSRVAAEASYPVLIKPRTQMFLDTHFKGELVADAADLSPRYQRFLERNRYGAPIATRRPDVVRPMVQAFHDQGGEIHSVSGFIDRTGELFVARAARKVLQRPRRIGVGLCFETAPLDEGLARRVRALCRGVGYFGAFEVEFIRSGGSFLLIDFNPRFYNQMALDIARGMPLPLFVWLAARGDEAGLAAAVAAAAEDGAAQPVFCNRFALSMLLTMRSLVRRSNGAERRRWRDWVLQTSALVDAAAHPDDRIPGFVDALNQVVAVARHPRAYLRNALLD